MSAPVSRTRRLILFDAQNGLCAGCGTPLSTRKNNRHRDLTTVDHTVPVKKGGVNRLGNFTLMHADCNEWKGDTLPTGCEIIWLLAVNARMGVPEAGWWVGPLRCGIKTDGPMPNV